MNVWRRRIAIVGPLVLGVGLLAITLARTDLRSTLDAAGQIGLALPLVLLPSAAWHVLRTIAWQQCFPAANRPSFARAFRLRLAAEAFSFVTVSGFAGDPLKVVLLQREVPPAIGAAAVALERILYLATTMAIVSAAAAIAATLLPLSRTWFLIYSAVALFPPVATLAVIGAVRWRRALRGAKKAAPAADPAVRSKRRQFLRDLDVTLRETLRRDPRRVTKVMLIEAASYGTMAMEVWLALRVAGTPTTGLGALAIETFTRVTSMVSAFIPAGIGALEASNVAGAAAVHAAAGGLALALVRRIRGLFWCAAGFIVYPPRLRERTSPPADMQSTLVVVDDSDSALGPLDTLGGLPIGERIVRAAARAGHQRVLVWSSPGRAALWTHIARRIASLIDVRPVHDPIEWRQEFSQIDRDVALTVLGPGIVASPAALIAARAVEPFSIDPVRDAGGQAMELNGVMRMLASQLASVDALAVIQPLTATPPLTFRATTADELAAAESSLRASIFKPTDGLLASFNRRISIPISVALIRSMRLNANAMSLLIIALGLWSGWLFSRGDYLTGVLAALASWAASVLDGCDGELARLQYTESAFGCWVDTFGDYTYYVAIFAGLTVGSVRATGWNGFWWVGGALAIGLLLTFALLVLLRERITAGRPEQLNRNTKAHFYGSGKRWAWLVAKLSNCATRATMPYGIVMFALIGQLPIVLLLAALGAQIYWISISVELRRLLAAAPPPLSHQPSTISHQPSAISHR